MTLFTQQEKHVILFLVCTLTVGYGVKLYQGSHLYDDFKPVTLIEKETFEKKATLAYDISKREGLNSSTEKDYKPQTEIININTAEKKNLVKLPKIGIVTAERIIRFRDDYGPFKSLDDLLKVKGIGPKTLEKLKPQITL
jgi:comEA protein|tara:strand:- start:5285 stop:5704 length:420 start_codon:yes stop_codon:yes gene_type:complete